MDKYTRICPKCKSMDVKSSTNVFWDSASYIGYVCQSCGFEGQIFPEVTTNPLKKTDKPKKNKKTFT